MLNLCSYFFISHKFMCKRIIILQDFNHYCISISFSTYYQITNTGHKTYERELYKGSHILHFSMDILLLSQNLLILYKQNSALKISAWRTIFHAYMALLPIYQSLSRRIIQKNNVVT
jgi:hypothetical protein